MSSTKKPLEKLYFTAGLTYIPGFRNIDYSDHAEITLDLEKDQLPFEDNSVEVIFSYHTLEHVRNYLHALGEIHRVLAHGGVLYLGVPYVTLTEFNLVNPYHHTHFNEFSFDFFDAAKAKGTAIEDNEILFTKLFHRFHYMPGFRKLPKRLQKTCRRHLFNVVQKIDFGLVAIKSDEPLTVDMSEAPHVAEFDRLFGKRELY